MPVPVVGLGVVSAVALAVTALPTAPAAATALEQPTHNSPQVERPASGEYVNPLAHTRVTPERIDQGIDYSGTGTLTSIGWARIRHVGMSNTGWPGAFIEYRLLHGRYAGRYVYYAEGVRPARGIYAGRLVRPGRAVAHLIRGWASGIEIGWGAGIGTEALAAKYDQYSYPTPCGKDFAAFIHKLGAPIP